MTMGEPMLQVEGLRFAFNQNGRQYTAVEDVSFTIEPGQTLGVVGESGCGKSVTATSILQLLPKSLGGITAGSIRFMGQELVHADTRTLRDIRGNRISMIFQEPMTSLNPVYTIGAQMAEMQLAHKKLTRREADRRSIEMLSKVGLSSPEKLLKSYPHELSGGMRQRAMIAMALSCDPLLLIADEPTTALDVTIQAQILQLMRDLQGKLGTAIMMITHDMGVVAEMADAVMIMYAGRVMEYGTAEQIFSDPKHPYTKGLLSSIPRMDRDVERLNTIPGNVPSLREMPKGCRYSTRCPDCMACCRDTDPGLQTLLGGRSVRCFHYVSEDQG